MFDKISYKSDIEEVKSKIYDNYMEIAYNLMGYEEYRKAKRHAFKEIIEYAIVHILVVIYCFIKSKSAVSDDVFIFAIVASVLFFIIVPCVAAFQNHKFTQKVKKFCIKAMLQNLTEAEYYTEKDVPDKPCIITTEDVRSFSITTSFVHKGAFDIIVGKYNNSEYNIQEIAVFSPGKNGGEEFRGAALKVCLDTNLDGWIEVATKKITDKFMSIKAVFIVSFIFFSLYLIGTFHALINESEYAPYIYCALVAFTALVSFAFAKATTAWQKLKYKGLLSPTVQTATSEINNKYDVRTSDSHVDLSRFATAELNEVLEKVMTLYKSEKVICRFNRDNVILLISTYPSYTNLFEIGGICSPPTSKKVAEKFVSQVAGILMFIDYITSTYCRED